MRISLVQHRIMPYRVPLYAALAGTPGIDLVVWARRSISPALAAVEAAGIEVRDAPFRRCGPFLWQPASISAARDAEVVVLGWNTRSLDIPLALRTARRHATGSVLWGHGFGKTRPGLGDRIRLRTARRADAVLLYGPSTRRRMVDLGLPEDRTFSAPNAIDQSSIAAAAADWRGRPAALAEFRSREGLTGPVVLFLSRLEADKNPPLLVEAFAQLLRKRPDAALVFVGDGSARAATEAAVDRFGIRDRVRFAGATYDEAKIAPWALSASLLVHPGGIGLSLMHAFGYGLPVITTDRMELHGPEVEILDQGRNGLFFRHGDATDLANRIETMLEDPARLATMSAEAFRTVDGPNGRNIPAMVSGFLAAIEAAAARCGHRAGIASDRASNR